MLCVWMYIISITITVRFNLVRLFWSFGIYRHDSCIWVLLKCLSIHLLSWLLSSLSLTTTTRFNSKRNKYVNVGIKSYNRDKLRKLWRVIDREERSNLLNNVRLNCLKFDLSLGCLELSMSDFIRHVFVWTNTA